MIYTVSDKNLEVVNFLLDDLNISVLKEDKIENGMILTLDMGENDYYHKKNSLEIYGRLDNTGDDFVKEVKKEVTKMAKTTNTKKGTIKSITLSAENLATLTTSKKVRVGNIWVGLENISDVMPKATVKKASKTVKKSKAVKKSTKKTPEKEVKKSKNPSDYRIEEINNSFMVYRDTEFLARCGSKQVAELEIKQDLTRG